MAEVTDEGTFDPAEFEDELAAAASNLEVGTRLWFQNDRIKVWEINLAPGERGRFTPIRVGTSGRWWSLGPAGSDRPTGPSRSDGTRWATPSTPSLLADPMIHDLENAGETRLRFVTVELLD